jgi:hypothetical protein
MPALLASAASLGSWLRQAPDPMLGFGSLWTVRRALAGIEVCAMLGKG